MRYPVSLRSCLSNRLGTIRPSSSRERSTTLTFDVVSFSVSRKCRAVSPSGLPASTSSTRSRCRAKVAALRRSRRLWEISGVSFPGRIRWPQLGGASFDSNRCGICLGPVFRLVPIDRYWVTTNFAETGCARGEGQYGSASPFPLQSKVVAARSELRVAGALRFAEAPVGLLAIRSTFRQSRRSSSHRLNAATSSAG